MNKTRAAIFNWLESIPSISEQILRIRRMTPGDQTPLYKIEGISIVTDIYVPTGDQRRNIFTEPYSSRLLQFKGIPTLEPILNPAVLDAADEEFRKLLILPSAERREAIVVDGPFWMLTEHPLQLEVPVKIDIWDGTKKSVLNLQSFRSIFTKLCEKRSQQLKDAGVECDMDELFMINETSL